MSVKYVEPYLPDDPDLGFRNGDDGKRIFIYDDKEYKEYQIIELMINSYGCGSDKCCYYIKELARIMDDDRIITDYKNVEGIINTMRDIILK